VVLEKLVVEDQELQLEMVVQVVQVVEEELTVQL
tara:strand:- start:395 stop:496 length:102 start_codon:yes stop_codon:yes gene_type:complete